MTPLEEKLKQLRDVRAAQEERKKAIAKQQEVLNANTAYQEMLAMKVDRDQRDDQITALEKEIRDLAVQAYIETGEKHPAPGVVVIMGKKPVFDPAAAEAWARTNAPAMFKFDPHAFIENGPNLGGPIVINEEPQARISKELP